MAQQNSGTRARTWLRWEWAAALITIVGGAIVAIAIAAYFTFRPSPQELALQPIHRTAEERAKVDTQAALALCTAALDASKAYGIVPQFGRLASRGLQVTGVKGRYKCLASTDAARYVVAADLVCRDLRDRRCISLYSVTQDDGTVLYQRQS